MRAELVTPPKKGIYAKFDEDVIAYYKGLGERGYQARMNAVLRAYMEAHSQNNPYLYGQKTRTHSLSVI